MPLDSRIIHRLYGMDVVRLYGDRARNNDSYLAAQVNRSLQQDQEHMDREKQSKANDLWNDVMDRVHFNVKMMGRKSQLPFA